MNEIYSEKFTAKVNEESGEGGTRFHEVILSGATTAHSLVMRNRRGTQDIEDGRTYEVVVREVEKKKPQQAAQKEKSSPPVAAKKPKTAKPKTAKAKPVTGVQSKPDFKVGEPNPELFVPNSAENDVGKSES